MQKLGVLLLTAISYLGPSTLLTADDRPNIVIILADDFGVGDIQAHYPENKIATPHLDLLVRQSTSFTDAHSPSAVCTPTRYGMLTGRYAWRTRLQEWVLAAYEPPLISEETLTLPGFLQQQGYYTSCIGKWHLGWTWPGSHPSRMSEEHNELAKLQWDFTNPIKGGPTERGFDYYFGVDVPNFPPFTFIQNDRVVTQPSEKYVVDPNVGIVLPQNFAGSPIAPGWRFDQILPEITRCAVEQISELAKQDAPFFLFFSMTSPHEPIVPSQDFRGKSGIAPIADFVIETDWSVGQIVKAIEEAGIADNTVVIFTADNGHSHYTGWKELIEAGHMPSGPYRGHKGDIWEGGHRVPLVIRWPNQIAADVLCDQMISLTDLFATCAELVGAVVPEAAAEDSISFLSSALGKKNNTGRSHMVNHSNHGEFAYRDGPWKLVFKMSGRTVHESRGKPTNAELYNLDNDIAEQNNLSKQRPEIVNSMTDQLSRIINTRPNDTEVRFTTIQKERWAPTLE